MPGFIDPPSPFAPLAEWEKFRDDIRELAKTDKDAAAELKAAERRIAELQAE